MRVALVASWVYATNEASGVTQRLWPDTYPPGDKPPGVRLFGAFCPLLAELRALHDALDSAGVQVKYIDHGIAIDSASGIRTVPSVLVIDDSGDGPKVARVYDVETSADLDAANFTQVQLDQDVADYQAAKAAQVQAEEDERTEDTTQQTTARAILAKIEADTITTEELKQALGVLIKRELRRSRKE